MSTDADPVHTPSVSAIGDWLQSVGLGRFRDLFAQQEVDDEALGEITEADLESWGVPFGPRKRLMRVIAERVDIMRPTSSRAVGGVERRQITALYCDMVGSTELTGRFDPEDLRAATRSYLEICHAAVEALGGHVASYHGDGALACFGWPKAHEDDPERTVHAALKIIRDLKTSLVESAVPIQVRIGIATGLVVVGDLIRTGASPEALIVGETPNLAARLQGVAEPNTVVVSASTRRRLGRVFDLRPAGSFSLKGFADAVACWEVVGETMVESRFAAAHDTSLPDPVGRESELSLLLRRWQFACEGEGQLVLLSGQAGIGKSRLAETLCARIAAQPHVRLLCQCSPHYTNSPFYAVLRMIERGARILPSDPPATKLRKLRALLRAGWGHTRMAPLLANLLSITDDLPADLASLDPVMRKQQMLAMLAEALTELSRRRPVLLLIEDGHWIDPSTHDLFRQIAKALHDSAIFMLVNLRPEGDAIWSGYADATRLQLSGLDRRSAMVLVETTAGGSAIAPILMDRILKKCDGVPLFIEELTKATLEASGGLDLPGAHGSSQPRNIDVPATLHDSLMARLDRLSDAKTVAQIGAVIGREFEHDVLETVTGLEARLLDHTLRRLVDAEILVESGTAARPLYAFKHALLRDAAYASLLRERRQELHGRIADVLNKTGEPGEVVPELLAYHYSEGSRIEEAINWWREAGRRATWRSANNEAISHLQNALTLLEAQAPSPERDRLEAELRLDLSGPAFSVGGFTDAVAEANIDQALMLCERIGDPHLSFLVLWGKAQSTASRGAMGRAVSEARRLVELAEATGQESLVASAARSLGIFSTMSGALQEGRTQLAKAVSGLSSVPARDIMFSHGLDPLVTARVNYALTLQQLGELDAAAKEMRIGVQEAREARHFSTLAYSLMRGGIFAMLSHDDDGVGRLGSELVGRASQHQAAAWLRLGQMLKGWHEARQGDTDLGLEQMLTAIRGQTVRGSYLLMPLMMTMYADLAAGAGLHAEALRQLDEAEALMEEQAQVIWRAELHRVRALALARRGASYAEIAPHVAQGRLVAQQQRALFGELRVALTGVHLAAELAFTERDAALDALRPVVARFPGHLDVPDLKVARILVGA
ncbi:MAG: AAA family ATPase [Reyranella sp.]|nr:AAA family ATPase [Reyranella sp.]MBL6650109.1 AAA family ATPase [Reyranella sp.]